MSNLATVHRREELSFEVRQNSGANQVTMAYNASSPENGLRSGFVNWDGGDAPSKTLDYEEVLLILSGEFGIRRSDGTAVVGTEGDVIHIPKGSTVTYFGKNAKLFFTITVPDSLK